MSKFRDDVQSLLTRFSRDLLSKLDRVDQAIGRPGSHPPKVATANDARVLAFVRQRDRRVGEVMARFGLSRSQAGCVRERLTARGLIRVVGEKRLAVWSAKVVKKGK